MVRKLQQISLSSGVREPVLSSQNPSRKSYCQPSARFVAAATSNGVRFGNGVFQTRQQNRLLNDLISTAGGPVRQSAARSLHPVALNGHLASHQPSERWHPQRIRPVQGQVAEMKSDACQRYKFNTSNQTYENQ
jgi:hypothetical protein